MQTSWKKKYAQDSVDSDGEEYEEESPKKQTRNDDIREKHKLTQQRSRIRKSRA